MRHLFGLRVCPWCPECNANDSGTVPCQDIFGSSAEPEGGVFGRVDAIYGSIENQKAGALHLHLQAFVQCLHQHNPLKIVMEAVETNTHIVDDYLAYVAHVSKTTYEDVSKWKAEQNAIEDKLLAFKDDVWTI